MHVLTEDAVLLCAHKLGKVHILPSQDIVTIMGRKVLVQPDPVGKTIVGCPNYGIGIKPCTSTLKVSKGYSSLLSINGIAVCLKPLKGLTDGTPPGVVEYTVQFPGQTFVEEK